MQKAYGRLLIIQTISLAIFVVQCTVIPQNHQFIVCSYFFYKKINRPILLTIILKSIHPAAWIGCALLMIYYHHHHHHLEFIFFPVM